MYSLDVVIKKFISIVENLKKNKKNNISIYQDTKLQYYGVKVSDVISDTLLEFSNDYHERVYIYQHCYVVPKNIAQLNFIEKDLDQISEQERLEILMK